MHLPQTHEVVKLMRSVIDQIAPDTILLTETNVPHQENISYFGQGDEARAVYQFSLAPLLLDAYLREDASLLQTWLSDLKYPDEGMTFFNFTASHDGIGMRPLEGIVPPDRIDALANRVLELGGHHDFVLKHGTVTISNGTQLAPQRQWGSTLGDGGHPT